MRECVCVCVCVSVVVHVMRRSSGGMRKMRRNATTEASNSCTHTRDQEHVAHNRSNKGVWVCVQCVCVCVILKGGFEKTRLRAETYCRGV